MRNKKYEIIEDEHSQMVCEPAVVYTTAQESSIPLHLDITLEDNAVVSDIKKALKMIKGIASVRVSHSNGISPSLKKKIDNARKEYAEGKCTECRSHEELNAFLESL